jgi:hypothetical protein
MSDYLVRLCPLPSERVGEAELAKPLQLSNLGIFRLAADLQSQEGMKRKVIQLGLQRISQVRIGQIYMINTPQILFMVSAAWRLFAEHDAK